MKLTKGFNVFVKTYNSISIDIPVLRANSPCYLCDGKKYTFKEFAFQLPYYFAKEDIEAIAKALKKLKIVATYGMEKVDKISFSGKVREIQELVDFVEDSIYSYKQPNPECKYIIQRTPIEIIKSTELGYWIIYERYCVIIKDDIE